MLFLSNVRQFEGCECHFSKPIDLIFFHETWGMSIKKPWIYVLISMLISSYSCIISWKERGYRGREKFLYIRRIYSQLIEWHKELQGDFECKLFYIFRYEIQKQWSGHVRLHLQAQVWLCERRSLKSFGEVQKLLDTSGILRDYSCKRSIF